MFVRAGTDFELLCDYETEAIRVRVNISPAGWMEMWREIEPLKSEEEWYKSRFASRVADDNILDMIHWFWYDCRKVE